MTESEDRTAATEPMPVPIDTPPRRNCLRKAGGLLSAWSWWLEADHPSRDVVDAEIEALVVELRCRDDAARQAAERRLRR